MSSGKLGIATLNEDPLIATTIRKSSVMLQKMLDSLLHPPCQVCGSHVWTRQIGRLRSGLNGAPLTASCPIGLWGQGWRSTRGVGASSRSRHQRAQQRRGCAPPASSKAAVAARTPHVGLVFDMERDGRHPRGKIPPSPLSNIRRDCRLMIDQALGKSGH
jgi:hypothetical protein